MTAVQTVHTVQYSMLHDQRYGEEIVMQQNHIIDTVRNMKDEACKRYKATIKGIFGSYARGEAKEDSDIDILVEFQKDATLLDLAGLGNFLEEKLHHRIDLVSQNAVREEIKSHLYKDIIYL
ncbi:MAG: nucleotidyltransferase family protein [Desulfobacterales bacterium]